MFTTTTKAVPQARRFSGLRTILEHRQSELVHELGDKIRAVRSGGLTDRDVLDDAEASEVDIQDDIGFALLQLKAETLKKIDTALRRIEEGEYGDCFECGGEIAEARLRALPFAIRCRDCEAVREGIDRRTHSMASRRSSTLLLTLAAHG
jgi:DnaK suppressor protein